MLSTYVPIKDDYSGYSFCGLNFFVAAACKDGGPEVILGTDAADLPYLEQRCELTDACFSESGMCSSKSQVCQCLPGRMCLKVVEVL